MDHDRAYSLLITNMTYQTTEKTVDSESKKNSGQQKYTEHKDITRIVSVKRLRK